MSRLRILGSLCVVLLALAACSSPDRSWEDISQAGVLRVGMDASYPPFESIDANGDFTGFDVDLAREIAERLGLEVQFINISYDGLYDALLGRSVDVLISALVAAPEFAGRAAFSDPYFNAGTHLLVLEDSPIAAMVDLEGRAVAVEYGSSGDVEARAWERRLAALEIVRNATAEEAVNALLVGQAEAALVDGISAQLALGTHPELHTAAVIEDSLLAVAVHPESTQLRSRINDALQEIRADGTLDQLLDRWFGSP